jgi:hypothetical protein
VIGPTGAVRVMVATKPVDFHKGAEGLATLVREVMQTDPFNGAIYLFRAKRADVALFMAGGRMPTSIGGTYDCIVSAGSGLYKHLARRAVPHMSQTQHCMRLQRVELSFLAEVVLS